MSDYEELCWMPAVELSRRISSREITPVDVAEAVLRRMSEVNPTLNAFVYHDPDQVMTDAKALTDQLAGGRPISPLHGIPYSLKEVCAVAGTPVTSGIVAFRNAVADHDEPVAARLKAAGALFLGKTNPAEGGYKANSSNHLYGTTHNPWHHGMTAGGSSSGAGAAVAAGIGQLAHGTDGGGSVRIPAALTGVVGFKPALGRIPQTRLAGRFHTFAYHGPIARTVADAALMLNTMAGFDPADPLSLPSDHVDYVAALERGIDGARIAWSADLGYATVDPEIKEICHQAVSAFTELGCVVEEADPGWANPEQAMWEGIWSPVYSSMLDAADWDAQAGQVDDQLVDVMRAGARLTARDIQRADAARGRMVDQMTAFMRDFDFLVTPVTTQPTFAADQFCPDSLTDAPLLHQLLGWLLTYPFNMTTNPATSVPAGFTAAGMPVGLQIVGGLRADAEVLRAAAAYERARPWSHRRPDVVAAQR
ncbi:aspartyl-tRNA(Asn)/glutamyl-tRNA(Gln) amidotransferase subunit A [Mycobacterium frederiksbergense]|uniref:amidase n=1 Tax=Mycolicibacterium frederiksbergense TaxID=117567 RepID=A0ABT6L185_9MYCO|nr:amidase family protein [Mycolicibacterium frederiksbergense]MDH6196704.1 aspartyl-tRNA(Asn)/glutamyl-tRNA(Gln) amidotransferase subunit A [Mycolicibacterium frederiksbergense]